MKIGLVDVDGHAKKKKWGATIYPNIALCKIARWHKEHGDTVEWVNGFEHYESDLENVAENVSEKRSPAR